MLKTISSAFILMYGVHLRYISVVPDSGQCSTMYKFLPKVASYFRLVEGDL